MANRVLLGNRATGGYGLYVSKANSNVLTCDRKELLFDSSQKRAGEVYAGGTTNPNPNWGEAAPGGPIGVCLPDCPNFSCQECANNFIVAITWGNVYNIFVDGNTSGQEDVDWPTNMCGGMQYWLNQESYIDEPIDGEGGPPEPDFTPKPDLDSQPLIPINESRLVKRFKKLANIKNKK